MKVKTVCASCGKETEKFPSKLRESNFCCKQCFVDYKNKIGFYKKKNHPQWKGSTLQKTCTHCKKLFWIKKSALEREGTGRGKFCSRECLKLAGSVVKKCEVCGKEFSIKKSHATSTEKPAGRYCSMKCRTVGFDARGILKGENAPRYIDGKSQTKEYVCRKSNERRAQVKTNGGSYTLKEWEDLCVKYNHKCLACGRNDVLLTVDHVIPIKSGGTNHISNIQPLCKSCNCKKSAKHIDYR
jgi:hypothetical protein